MKIGALVILTLLLDTTFAQNLVPNPSFEQYYECPGSYNRQGSARNFAPGWVSPTLGTPDLFNRCSFGNAGVPHNWAGMAHAHKGYGYSGIYAYISNNNYREYLQAKLTHKLVEGATYKVEFFYQLADFSKFGVDRIGVLLSDSVEQVSHDRVWTIEPSYTAVMDSVRSRNIEIWNYAHFEYVAKGGEQFISIGNFSPDSQLKKYYLTSKVDEPLLSKAAYFYIDDVSVTALDKTKPKIDSVDLAGKKIVKPNETYILKRIYFEFDSYSLMPLSEPELNLLVSIMNKNPKWKVELSGHTDEKGNNLYNYNLSLNRAKSVGYYLTQSGIAQARVITKGFGKLKPLSKAKTEEAHATNRRVEVKFLDK
jgi:outer membrane protein OmpA-like peptidoglycan-associated protein